MTAKTEQAIARLLDENLSLGLIITLHRGNAAPDKLPTLIAWIRTLSARGVGRIRLHLLESDSFHIRQKFGLTTAENLHALTQFEALEAELGQKFFDIFDDMKRMLGFQDYKASCVWRGCDSYNTEAVQSVNHLGLLTNCGRTTQDGVDFLKAEDHGYERYLALYHTPHEHGGCQDCRFFLACKGYCPGTAIHNDWRNRTEYCDLLTQLFERVEAEMVAKGQTPLSLHPERAQYEQIMLTAWAEGKNPSVGHPKGDARLIPLSGNGARPEGSPRPPFIRLAWGSADARAIWEPRMVGIRQAWQVLELISVREGLRACALVTLSETEFGRLHKRAQKYGLTYAELPPPLGSPKKDDRFVALSASTTASGGALANFQTAWHAADHAEIGRLLGYPACCIAAFQKNGAAHPLQDPIWQTALQTSGVPKTPPESPPYQEFDNDPHTNILLTPLGIHPVLHLPCTFTCAETLSIAQKFLHLGRENHLSGEMNDLLSILSWPVEWSALHGIAEIKTPLFKISTQTVATSHKHTLRLKSSAFPETGVHGMKFPFLG